MASARPRVLIVDTPRAAPLLARLLGEQFDVDCAISWDQAVRCLQTMRPQVVLVGYHFDEMRPYRFLRHIREQPQSADIGVVVVRGLPLLHIEASDDDIRESYLNLGANAYAAVHKSATGDEARELSAYLRGLVVELIAKQLSPRAA